MKEVRLIFMKDGLIKILAPGNKGRDTASFTKTPAQSLGTIMERHRGPSYAHHHHDVRVESKVEGS